MTVRRQIRRNERNDNSIPTINRRRSTPNSANTSICARSSTTAKADGPSNTPAKIYPTNAGWRNRSIAIPQTSAANTTAAIPVSELCTSASISLA